MIKLIIYRKHYRNYRLKLAWTWFIWSLRSKSNSLYSIKWWVKLNSVMKMIMRFFYLLLLLKHQICGKFNALGCKRCYLFLGRLKKIFVEIRFMERIDKLKRSFCVLDFQVMLFYFMDLKYLQKMNIIPMKP